MDDHLSQESRPPRGPAIPFRRIRRVGRPVPGPSRRGAAAGRHPLRRRALSDACTASSTSGGPDRPRGGGTARLPPQPGNEIVVNFPVKNGRRPDRGLTGYRPSAHNALGPFQGGWRFPPHRRSRLDAAPSPAAYLENRRRGDPLRPAAWGDPDHPAGVLRGGAGANHPPLHFAARRRNIGPEHDILGPDVNTDEQIMAWILDTYLSTVPGADRPPEHPRRHREAGPSGGSHGPRKGDRDLGGRLR